ncbi:uncharacterized protein CC84DRAFT_1240906, partial [Paraphaeosphaeria sporulosa]
RIWNEDTPVLTILYQVTTLVYIQRYLCVKTPEVITHDQTRGNGLSQRYMLQTRLSGTPLVQLCPKLNLQQKKSIVHCITKFMLALYNREIPCAGIISPDNTIPISAAQGSIRYRSCALSLRRPRLTKSTPPPQPPRPRAPSSSRSASANANGRRKPGLA